MPDDSTRPFLDRPPAYRIVRTSILTPPLVVVAAIAVAFLAPALSLSPTVAWLLETALALLAPLAVWFATPRTPETDVGFDARLWVALVALSLAGSMTVLLVLVVAGFT
jgi:hypothetical protein